MAISDVAPMACLLDLIDEEWDAEIYDLLERDLEDHNEDELAELEELDWLEERDELDELEDELFGTHANGSQAGNLGGGQYEKTLHERILQSIKDDNRLSIIRGLDSELSMDDLIEARASLLALVMEPGLADLDPDQGGRRKRKPHKPRRPYTVTCALKQTNWFERSFQWENAQFRAFYRMSKPTFWEIVRILEQNTLFQSTGRKPQRPVPYQFGVFLLRYASPGAVARYPMMLSSVGEGTVLLYSRRVIRALREFGLTCVGWPTPERKAVIKAGFKKKCGLDNVIGALDGTLAKLAKKPRVEGDSYISRKGTASVAVQVITDHEGRIIAFQVGHPGSNNDTTVWKKSDVYVKRDKLFAPGEFLLADGGYPLSPYVLIPFNKNERVVDGHRKRTFNHRISSARVVIERTFGQLKARFPALHELGAVGDMTDLYRAIEALLVLYNMCFDLHDRVDGLVDNFTQSRVGRGEDPYDYVAQQSDESDGSDVEQEENRARERDLRKEGKIFRNRCLDIICPT